MDPIIITGAGIVSAIGIGKQETIEALLTERSGVGPIRYLKTEHHEFPVGEVPLSNEQMEQRLGILPGTPTTRTALMGMLALGEALHQAGLDANQLPHVGFVSGTTVGGMDKSEQYYLDFLENDAHDEYIRTHDCGACTEMIGDHFGHFAFATTLSTACSSAANAIILGANMLRTGEAECVVVGGSECITKFHLNGFNSLMILDERPCRPFDPTRAGLNLGEGAAYLVMETAAHAARRGATPIGVLSGYGNACDAFHQTASSPNGEGAFQSMSQALQMSGLKPTDVDYVNAHGTGTPNNDVSESQAMRRLFGEDVPPMSSTKAFTGHTTSASGSIEAVICLLAMQHGFIPANLNYTASPETDTEGCIRPVTSTLKGTKLRHVLCNSFGFGGNDSSLLLSAVGTELNTRPIPIEKKDIYILSASHVSLQQPLTEEWMDVPVRYTEQYHRALDPDFKPYISPIEARRMGKILKRAIATAKDSLTKSGLDAVDAIITGTGLGCIENTELFLTALCREGEQMLKPTYFMQSTHNTVSSMVAIQQKNHGYNVTYAHKGVSFCSALYDAFLQLKIGSIHSAMVNGHDELTPTYFTLLQKAGFVGQASEVAGETAISVIVADHQDSPHAKPLCRIAGMKMLYSPTENQLQEAVNGLLHNAGLTIKDLSGVMTGMSGNPANDQPYIKDCDKLFPQVPMVKYKHLFGETYTASAASLYAAAQCIAIGQIPEALMVEKSRPLPSCINSLMLYNRSDGKDISLILLTR